MFEKIITFFKNIATSPIYSNYLSKIVFTLSVIIISLILIRSIKKILKTVTRKKKLTVGQEYAYYQLTKYFIVIIAVVLIIESYFDKDITILLAGSTALLVGLGLGIQQLFNDLVSGFFLLFEDTVRVNDVIEVDGEVSRVKQIGIRTSRIVNRDGIHIIIPNSKIVSNTVINWSTHGFNTRFMLKVGVSYKSDIQLVKKVMLDCAKRHNEVLKTPKAFVRFLDFSDSSLDFQLVFWSKNRFRIENVKSDLRYMIFAAFIDNKISIPFPQRDIHLRTDETKGDTTVDPNLFSL